MVMSMAESEEGRSSAETGYVSIGDRLRLASISGLFPRVFSRLSERVTPLVTGYQRHCIPPIRVPTPASYKHRKLRG